MLPAGPLPGNLIAIGAGQGRPGVDAQGLRAGAVVSVRVLADLGGGLYRVAAGGSVFTAKSDRALGAGSSFQARVERRGEALALRPLVERAAQPAAAGGPNGPLLAGDPLLAGVDLVTSSAVAALLREGSAPRPEAVARVRRAFGRASAAGEDSGEADRAELAARMEAEGIPAEDDALDAIHAESGGGGGRRPGDSPSREGPGGGAPREPPREPRDGAAREAASLGACLSDLDSPFDLELPEDRLPAALGALLKGLSLRSGGDGCLLNLFNHRAGPAGSWTYAPFAFELDSIAFEGTIRIQSPRLAGGPGRIEAGFTARRAGKAAADDAGRRWSLALDFGAGGGSSLLVGCGDEGRAARSARLLPSLESELLAGGRRAKVVLYGRRRGASGAAGSEGGVDVEA